MQTFMVRVDLLCCTTPFPHVYTLTAVAWPSLSNLRLVASLRYPRSQSQRFGAERKEVFRVLCGTYLGSGCHCVLSSWEGTWYFWVWHLSDSKSLVHSTLPWTLLKPFCSKPCTKYCTAGSDWRLISPSHGRKQEIHRFTSTVAVELLLPYPWQSAWQKKNGCLWREDEVGLWGIPSPPFSCW